MLGAAFLAVAAMVVIGNVAKIRAWLDDAERFACSKENAWMELSKIIDETRSIGDPWEDLDDAGRKTILDHSNCDVLIVVEPIPGMKKAKRFPGAIPTTWPDRPPLPVRRD